MLRTSSAASSLCVGRLAPSLPVVNAVDDVVVMRRTRRSDEDDKNKDEDENEDAAVPVDEAEAGG